jgi:hypothetical protein
MSTIEALVRIGAFSKIEVELGVGEQAMRLFFGTRSFTEWLTTLVQGAEPKNRVGEASAAEQVDQLLHAFSIGLPLVYLRQFRVIRAEKNAIWELKTPDVRIFGWFLQKDCFVGVFGDWADHVKDHDLYRGYRIAIRRLRRELGVEDQLCVKGTSPSDVISV